MKYPLTAALALLLGTALAAGAQANTAVKKHVISAYQRTMQTGQITKSKPTVQQVRHVRNIGVHRTKVAHRTIRHHQMTTGFGWSMPLAKAAVGGTAIPPATPAPKQRRRRKPVERAIRPWPGDAPGHGVQCESCDSSRRHEMRRAR